MKIPRELNDAMSRNAQAEKEKQARVTLASAEVAIAQQIAEASHIYAHNPVALQIRQMGLIYDMNKDRGVTILVPTDMANALGASIALNVNNPDFPPPTPPIVPFTPPRLCSSSVERAAFWKKRRKNFLDFWPVALKPIRPKGTLRLIGSGKRCRSDQHRSRSSPAAPRPWWMLRRGTPPPNEKIQPLNTQRMVRQNNARMFSPPLTREVGRTALKTNQFYVIFTVG